MSCITVFYNVYLLKQINQQNTWQSDLIHAEFFVYLKPV